MQAKKFLVRHVGNMGDMVFLVPPALDMLKKKFPGCHITFVTAWGFKNRKRRFPYFRKQDNWGERNQSGFCIALMLADSRIDQLVHFSTTQLSLTGEICREGNKSFPTWSEKHYEEQKKSGTYDDVFELDVGLSQETNPMDTIYEVLGMKGETYSNYKLYPSKEDMAVAREVMKDAVTPRIVLLESLDGVTARNWDPMKVQQLTAAIKKTYGVEPLWFGSKHIPTYQGRPLTLMENIATLSYCDVGIGVLSGPLHFAAAVGLPTLTLYADHPVNRAAPAYFLNEYISDEQKQHRTLLAPTNYNDIRILKEGSTLAGLTPYEQKVQEFVSWHAPGKQATKSCLAVLTVDEVMSVLTDMLSPA